MTDGPAIDLRDVTKVYPRHVHALRGVTLRVGRGEVFGLLGPNGAGKSTLVKVMMTVVRPTRASGTVLGQPVGHKPTLARIGYLPENHRFPKYLTGRQVLEFFAALAKIDRRTRRRRSAELLELVGMGDWADARISTYSKGMLQRVGLAQALVHEPELVVLDEPTDGVDPIGRRDILNVLGQLRARQKTVFINSHALSELETICDRVAILVQGQVARQGSIDELTIARQRYEIEIGSSDSMNLRERVVALVPAQWKPAPASTNVAQPPPAVFDRRSKVPDPGQETSAFGGTQPGAAVSHSETRHFIAPRQIDFGSLDGINLELDGRVLRIATADVHRIQSFIDRIRAAGLLIVRVQQVRPSLEDLFLDTVAHPGAGRSALPGAARVPAGEGAPE